MAMEVILGHHDGYSLDVNNYRIFHDLDSDKMDFLPHGMDLMFEDPSAPIAGPMRGLVAQSVMDDAELRKRYVARVAALSTNVLRVSAIINRIHELTRQIQSCLTNDPFGNGQRDPSGAAEIVEFFVRRSDYLRKQFLRVNP